MVWKETWWAEFGPDAAAICAGQCVSGAAAALDNGVTIYAIHANTQEPRNTVPMSRLVTPDRLFIGRLRKPQRVPPAVAKTGLFTGRGM